MNPVEECLSHEEEDKEEVKSVTNLIGKDRGFSTTGGPTKNLENHRRRDGGGRSGTNARKGMLLDNWLLEGDRPINTKAE